MKTLKFAVTAVAAMLASGAVAHEYHQHGAAQPAAQQITVSCQRYASRQVIWDKPSGAFVDDLRAVGYSPSDALGIATSICRDERLVGDRAALGAAMRRFLETTPPTR